MLSWSYFTCTLTIPGYVPPGWLPAASEMVRSQLLLAFFPSAGSDTAYNLQEALVQLERQEAMQMRKDAGVPRTRRCKKCRVSLDLLQTANLEGPPPPKRPPRLIASAKAEV